METRRRPAEGADARAYIVGDLLLIKTVHLFPDRSVDRRVSGVETHGHLSGFFRFLHGIDHLVERHIGAV